MKRFARTLGIGFLLLLVSLPFGSSAGARSAPERPIPPEVGEQILAHMRNASQAARAEGRREREQIKRQIAANERQIGELRDQQAALRSEQESLQELQGKIDEYRRKTEGLGGGTGNLDQQLDEIERGIDQYSQAMAHERNRQLTDIMIFEAAYDEIAAFESPEESRRWTEKVDIGDKPTRVNDTRAWMDAQSAFAEQYQEGLRSGRIRPPEGYSVDRVIGAMQGTAPPLSFGADEQRAWQVHDEIVGALRTHGSSGAVLGMEGSSTAGLSFLKSKDPAILARLKAVEERGATLDQVTIVRERVVTETVSVHVRGQPDSILVDRQLLDVRVSFHVHDGGVPIEPIEITGKVWSPITSDADIHAIGPEVLRQMKGAEVPLLPNVAERVLTPDGERAQRILFDHGDERAKSTRLFTQLDPMTPTIDGIIQGALKDDRGIDRVAIDYSWKENLTAGHVWMLDLPDYRRMWSALTVDQQSAILETARRMNPGFEAEAFLRQVEPGNHLEFLTDKKRELLRKRADGEEAKKLADEIRKGAKGSVGSEPGESIDTIHAKARAKAVALSRERSRVERLARKLVEDTATLRKGATRVANLGGRFLPYLGAGLMGVHLLDLGSKWREIRRLEEAGRCGDAALLRREFRDTVTSDLLLELGSYSAATAFLSALMGLNFTGAQESWRRQVERILQDVENGIVEPNRRIYELASGPVETVLGRRRSTLMGQELALSTRIGELGDDPSAQPVMDELRRVRTELDYLKTLPQDAFHAPSYEDNADYYEDLARNRLNEELEFQLGDSAAEMADPSRWPLEQFRARLQENPSWLNYLGMPCDLLNEMSRLAREGVPHEKAAQGPVAVLQKIFRNPETIQDALERLILEGVELEENTKRSLSRYAPPREGSPCTTRTSLVANPGDPPDDYAGCDSPRRDPPAVLPPVFESALAAASSRLRDSETRLFLEALRATHQDVQGLHGAVHPETVHLWRKFLENIVDTLADRTAQIPDEVAESIQARTFPVKLWGVEADIPGYPVVWAKKHGKGFARLLDRHIRPLGENLWRASRIAILREGTYEPLMNFLLDHGVYVSLANIEDLERLSGFDLLVLPSGSLAGMGNSDLIRRHLASFAANGGMVFAFAQQNGADFKALPRGNRLEAFGWNEDQSCQFQSSLVTEYHPILAGQTRPQPDFNVDGFFLAVPENAQVLLRRRANDRPCLIRYEVGVGTVFASTLFSDSAMLQHQATTDEKRLILDLVRFGLGEGLLLPMVRGTPGESITVRIPVANPTETAAGSVEWVLVDSAGKEVLRMAVETSLPAKSEREFEFSFPLPRGAVGILNGRYLLRSAAGTEIHRSRDAAQVESTRLQPTSGGVSRAAIAVSVQADAERVPEGSIAGFTILVFNQGSEARSVPIRWHAGHRSRTGEAVLSVPAGGKASHRVLFEVRGIDTLFAEALDSAGNVLATALKAIFTFAPTFGIELSSDRERYGEGDAIQAQVRFRNPDEVHYTYKGSWRMTDGEGRIVYAETVLNRLRAKEEVELTETIPIPADLLRGKLRLEFATYLGDRASAFSQRTVDYVPEPRRFSFKIQDWQTGTGVAGATVTLFGDGRRSVLTNADGIAEADLPPGRYNVETVAPGYHRATRALTLRPDSPVQALPLWSSTLDPLRFAVVSGKIMNWGRTPIPGTLIVVRHAVLGEIEMPLDETGDYQLVLTWGESYTIWVRLQGVDISQPITFSVRENAIPGLDLFVYAGRVSGRLRDLTTDAPLAGVKIRVDGAIHLLTGNDGSYSVFVPGGERTIAVVDDRFDPTERKVRMVARNIEDVDLYGYAREYFATVRVTDRGNGKPVAGASVGAANAILSGSPTDPWARIEGAEELTVYLNETIWTRFLTAAEPVYVSLAKGDRIRATGARVWLHDLATQTTRELAAPSGPWERERSVAVTDSQGEARILLPRGPVLLSITKSGYAPKSDALMVVGGRSLLETELVPQSRRSLKVKVEEGAGVRVAIPNVVLTGEEPLLIRRNGRKLYEGEGAGPARVLLSAREGDEIEVEAGELQHLENGAREKIVGLIRIGPKMGENYDAGVETNEQGEALVESVPVVPLRDPSLMFAGSVVAQKEGYNLRSYRAVYTPWQYSQRARLRLAKGSGNEGEVRIRLLDSEGMPLSGQWIEIRRPDGTRYLSTQWWNYSDAEGNLAIVLPPGPWGIGFNPDRFLHVRTNRHFEVTAGEVSEVEVVVAPPTGVVRVELRDATSGVPIEMYYDFLNEQGHSPRGSAANVALHTGSTKEFRIPAGRFGLWAGAREHYQIARLEACKRVGPGDRASIVLDLLPDFGWANLRMYDVITGAPAGAGWFDGRDPRGFDDTVRTSVGNHGVFVSSWGMVTFGTQIAPVYPGRVTRVQFHNQYVETGTFKISGRVFGEIGIPGATVTLEGVEGGQPRSLTVRTDERGTFQIERLGWRPFTVRASADGYRPVERPIYLIPPGTAFLPAPFAEVEIRLIRAIQKGGITIRALHQFTGAPVAGADVRIVAGGKAFAAVTDDQGVARLTDLPSNIAAVEISKGGFLISTQTIEGADLAVRLTPLEEERIVAPARLEIAELPTEVVWKAGEASALAFRARNTGGETGLFRIPLTVPGIHQEVQDVLLAPGEEREVRFRFQAPADVDTRTGSARLAIGDRILDLPFRLDGVQVRVEARLDREFYSEGETAHLAMKIQGPTVSLTGYARVQLGDFLVTKEFSLPAGGTSEVTVGVPVRFDGNKLLFGVYLDSGRSLFLDSYYLRSKDDLLGVAADRQQYEQGDAGKLRVKTEAPGTLSIEGPPAWKHLPTPRHLEIGEHLLDFRVPAELRTGTHVLEAILRTQDEEIRKRVLVDVRGFQIRIKDVHRTVRPQALEGFVDLETEIESSRPMATTVYAVCIHPRGQIVGAVEFRVVLISGANRMHLRVPYATDRDGVYRIRFSFKVDLQDQPALLMADGIEAFDVIDRIAPSVIDYEPKEGRVRSRTEIRVTFSEIMDPRSTASAFRIEPSVGGTLEVAGDTLRFHPSEHFRALRHTVTITTAAKDASNSGNPLDREFSWSFGVLDPNGRVDSDGDGLPDEFEEQYGPLEPDADDDGDGRSNLEEYRLGTDPKSTDLVGERPVAGTSPSPVPQEVFESDCALTIARFSPRPEAITGTARNADRVRLTIRDSWERFWDGADWVHGEKILTAVGRRNWLYPAPAFQEGQSYRIRAWANGAEAEADFLYDAVPPTSQISDTEGRIRGHAGDAASGISRVEVRLIHERGDTGWIPCAGTDSWELGLALDAGIRYWAASRATDRAGNIENPVWISFTAQRDSPEVPEADQTPPECRIFARGIYGPRIYSGRIHGRVNKSSLTNVRIVRLVDEASWNGRYWTAAETWMEAEGPEDWSIPFDIQAGRFRITAVSIDAAGHRSSDVQEVAFDTESPRSVVAPRFSEGRILGTVEDPGFSPGLDRVEIEIVDRNGEGKTRTASLEGDRWSVAVPGAPSRVRVRAVDLAENVEVEPVEGTVGRSDPLCYGGVPKSVRLPAVPVLLLGLLLMTVPIRRRSHG